MFKKIFDYEEQSILFYLVQEHYDMSLKEFIERSNENIENISILMILKDVTEGLNYLHNKEIVHKNICPKNIGIDVKKRSAKLCNIAFDDINLMVNN